MASIAIADVINTEHLPIDAQDVVTKVSIVIAGNIAGREPHEKVVIASAGSPEVDTIVTYFPDPITYVYTAPEHATFGAERSFALPEGYNPFLAPDDVLIPALGPVVNITDAASVKDADSLTFATLTSVGSVASISYGYAPEIVGFKLRYRAETSVPGIHLLVIQGAGRANGYQVWARYRLLSSDEEPDEMYLVLPHDARNQLVNTATVTSTRQQSLSLVAPGSLSLLHVYEYYPLVLNAAMLEEVAKAQVRVPAALPQRVTVLGYVEPDREHTIVGWPGGDYTALVAQHQYELDRTIIDFEQAGAPTGLPAEAAEVARERSVAVESTVQRRAYALKMGERA